MDMTKTKTPIEHCRNFEETLHDQETGADDMSLDEVFDRHQTALAQMAAAAHFAAHYLHHLEDHNDSPGNPEIALGLLSLASDRTQEMIQLLSSQANTGSPEAEAAESLQIPSRKENPNE